MVYLLVVHLDSLRVAKWASLLVEQKGSYLVELMVEATECKLAVHLVANWVVNLVDLLAAC